MKLVREVQEREAQLAKSEADRTRVLNEQKSHAEARYIQETRLQATIAQQSKLIDYLQKVGTISPRSGGFDRIKKVQVLLFSLTGCVLASLPGPFVHGEETGNHCMCICQSYQENLVPRTQAFPAKERPVYEASPCLA